MNIKGLDEKKMIKLTKELMRVLSTSRGEEEKVDDFEKRVKGDMENILEINTQNQNKKNEVSKHE